MFRLSFEPIEPNAVDIYATELVRATESIVSPLGWGREDIRRHIHETTDATLQAYK